MRNDVVVNAASEVAADGTDFVFPPQIRLWLGEKCCCNISYLDVVATLLILLFPLRKKFRLGIMFLLQKRF